MDINPSSTNIINPAPATAPQSPDSVHQRSASAMLKPQGNFDWLYALLWDLGAYFRKNACLLSKVVHWLYTAQRLISFKFGVALSLVVATSSS
jgi:hypothetical protein